MQKTELKFALEDTNYDINTVRNKTSNVVDILEAVFQNTMKKEKT